ncbi:MAG: HDIG domain-containing protein [Candidatus Poribacteria bacterium]|nr:HDIG domain-containing protein [Candidatus Poribacteria bacterium]
MRFLPRLGRLTRRRQHVARTVAASTTPYESFFPNKENRHWWIGGFLVTIFIAIIALPVGFHRRVPDENETERNREFARKNTTPIFKLDMRQLEQAKLVFTRVQAVMNTNLLSLDEKETALLESSEFTLETHYLKDVDLALLLRRSALFNDIREHTLIALERTMSRGVVLGGNGTGSLRAELAEYFDPVYTTQWDSVESMSIRVRSGDRILSVTDTLTKDEAIRELQRYVRTIEPKVGQSDDDLVVIQDLTLQIAEEFIHLNLTFDEEATRREQEVRAAAVKTVYQTRQGRPLVVYFGTFLIVGLIGLMSGLFFVQQRNRSMALRQHATFGLIIGATTILLYLLVRVVDNQRDVDFPVLLVPVCIAAALSSILFGVSFGIYSTTILSVIAGLMMGVTAPTSVAQFLTLMTTGFLAAYATSEVHHRRDLFIAGFNVTLVATAVYLGAAFVSAQTLGWELLRSAAWAFASGILVMVIVPGALPPFESLAGTASDLELLELADLNHDLLTRMEEIAPGTYNHSLNVARLSEAAAEVIGANPVLARVGSYYHDIGKMNNAEYFIENQEGGPNPHDGLKPSMSARVIIAHVKNGVELAKEYKLPKTIIDLIAQHHGTSLIRVFYHKANEQGDAADESDFRYPGPKPQSKIAAIMMIADSIEPAANARFKNLAALGRRDCEQLAEEITKHYIADGQLDECDLTLHDLQLIQDSFQRTLTGMYHSRIEYPRGKPPEGGSAPATLPPQNGSTEAKADTHAVVADQSSHQKEIVVDDDTSV